MNARRATQLAVVVVLLLSGALAWRTWKRRQPVVAVVEHAQCRERSVPLPAVSPSSAPLTVVAPGVTLRIDGRAPEPQLTEGVHQLEATAPEAQPARLALRVVGPVVIDARVSHGAVTVLPFGARCDGCSMAETDLDVRYRTNVFGALPDVASALSTGDWLRAAQTVRAVPMQDRTTPEASRLLAVLYALAGRVSLADELVRTLPKNDPLHAALARQEEQVRERSLTKLETEVARWNATSDRFQRVTDAFVEDAPDLMTELTWAFDGYSTRFAQAHTAGDSLAAEAALAGASKVLNDGLTRLRALRRDDCAWQRRVVATF